MERALLALHCDPNGPQKRFLGEIGTVMKQLDQGRLYVATCGHWVENPFVLQQLSALETTSHAVRCGCRCKVYCILLVVRRCYQKRSLYSTSACQQLCAFGFASLSRCSISMSVRSYATNCGKERCGRDDRRTNCTAGNVGFGKVLNPWPNPFAGSDTNRTPTEVGEIVVAASAHPTDTESPEMETAAVTSVATPTAASCCFSHPGPV
jgi:hypothetical protein